MQRTFSLYYFVFFVAMASTQPFLSLYLNGRGISSVNIGFILAAGACAGIFAQPMFGFLSDRAPDQRRILLLTAFLSPIMFAGYALTKNFFVLLLVSVLFAIVQSSSPIADAIAVQEGVRSGFSYGQIRLWGALSFALTTMVAGYFYHRSGFAWSFVIYGGLTTVLMMVTILLPKAPSVDRAIGLPFHGIWNVMKNPYLMSFILICFVLSTAITINFNFLPLYFSALHHPLGLVGLNFTVAALVEVPFFYISATLMDRFGKMPIIMLASALYLLKYVIMALAPSTTVVISIQILDGIAYALYWSAGVQIVADLAPPTQTATAQTLFGAIASSLSSIVGSSVGGWLLGGFGPLVLYACNAALAFVALAGFFMFARLQMRKGHRQPEA